MTNRLRQESRNRPCQVRIPGICSHNPQTTVGAHYRLTGLSGIGKKPNDLLLAWADARCHDAIDGRVRTGFTHTELRLMHAEGVFRTIAALLDEGWHLEPPK